MLILRNRDKRTLLESLENNPVTAILGPRQCGKSTLAKSLGAEHYFDLENPRDLSRLENPQTALEQLRGLIVIDEIQRLPELFPLLRFLVDSRPEQKYLILGSASVELLRQSSESLAGRISYIELGGFRVDDLENWAPLWMRGGLPRSCLSPGDQKSMNWRENYIRTFLERDIPQLGIRIPPQSLRRFWTMLSHYHAQLLNSSELALSFGMSDKTVRSYIDILEGTLMIRILRPWFVNVSKRVIKTPKIYFRDSGLFHSFMQCSTRADIESHPKLGASWEGFALEQVIMHLGKTADSVWFYRTQKGAELDLFWQSHGKNYGVEFKYGDAPKITRSMRNVFADLDLERLWVVYPGAESWPLDEYMSVLSISNLKAIPKD